MARVLAAGFFDGVHLGHRKILNGADAALTFRNHPLSVLLPSEAPPLLMTFGERVAEIRACGVEDVFALDFTRELADTSPEDFAGRIRAMGAEVVRCGANWRFGRGGVGDAEFLRRHGFSVEVVSYAEYDGGPVSSTRIREALKDGRIDDANAMLGRPWRVSGEVASGKGFGSKMGFPTVNLRLPAFLPKIPLGVYEVSACGARAIANWGVAPTMGERAWPEPVLELHFPGECPAECSEGPVAVDFLRFIRHERKFATLDELKAQIESDCRVLADDGLAR